MADLVLTPLTSCSFLFASYFALTNVSDRCVSEGVTYDLQQGRHLGRGGPPNTWTYKLTA